VARKIHARTRCGLRRCIENVGKQRLEQSGKQRVNENDEENFQAAYKKLRRSCKNVTRIIMGLRVPQLNAT
jgi:hypothetical protein